jgi:AcrR family transcriptional regulator
MANWERRAARKAENREHLIDAAAELFAEKGYWGVSLDEVADRAGLTKGAVYSSFESKEALLMAVTWSRRVEVDEAELPDASSPLGEQMRSIGRMLAELALSDAVRAIAPRELELSTLALSSEPVRRALVEMGSLQRSGWAAMLEARADEQEHDLPLPAAEIATILSAVRSGLMRLRTLDPDSVPAHYFEDAFELITTGSVTRRKRTPRRAKRAR